ncbi:MAG: N-acetyltransferase [Desulfobacteraceae bacterium]|nr:MAG: N-acetyltransferase [Desulfobacteraceae bacterium]
MLAGKNLRLIPLAAEHLAKTRQWANDLELNAGILRVLPVTEYDQEQWYANLCRDSSRIVFAVHLLETDAHIGNCGFYHIDYLHRRGELWLLIGEKSCQGKGYGQEIVKLMLSFGFDSLNLNRIFLHVREDHIPAIKLYQTIGLQNEGALREHYFLQGQYVNVLTMSILRNEYDATK